MAAVVTPTAGSSDPPRAPVSPQSPSHRAASQPPRKTFHLPRFRTVLWAVFGGMLLVCAYDVVLCALAPCPFREVGSRTAMAEERCVDDIYRIMVVRVPALLLTFLIVTVHAGYRVWRILGYQRHHLPHWLTVALRLRTRADLWVAAASRDLFEETVRALRSSNVLVGSLLLPFAAAMGTSSIVSGFTGLPKTYDDPEVVEMCQSVDLCHACFAFAASLVSLNVLLLTLVTIPLHTVPPVVWGRSMELAMKKTGETRVRRLITLPYFSLGGYAACLYQATHHQTRIITVDASPKEAVLLLSMQVSTVLYLLGMLFWVSLVPYDFVSELYAQLLPFKNYGASNTNSSSRVTLKGRGSRLSVSSRRSSVGSERSVDVAVNFSPAARILNWWTGSQGTSANQRQEVLLLISLLLWAQRVVARAPLWQCVLVFMLRGVVFVLLMATREITSDFDTIAKEPGFGLVVEAKPLCRALKSALHGAGRNQQYYPSSAPLRHLPRYKATLHRMQNAAAVSYRWQPGERQLSTDCNLNMNEYQMGCLLEALSRSRAKYVWLDRLSVPQWECSLKYTILARMMAVYAAAQCTIALRTVEPHGSRYHQRAWTFQEFCASCDLSIRTEEVPEADGENGGYCAVANGEEQRAADLRTRFHESIDDVVPFWLRDEEIDASEAKALVRECMDLGVTLSCQVAGDKVRALLPLLAHTPVEGQGELIALVLRISSASGRDLQEWKSALLDQHMTLQKAKDIDGRVISSRSASLPPARHSPSDYPTHTTSTAAAAALLLSSTTVIPTTAVVAIRPAAPPASVASMAKSSFEVGVSQRQADVDDDDGTTRRGGLKRWRSDFASRAELLSADKVDGHSSSRTPLRHFHDAGSLVGTQASGRGDDNDIGSTRRGNIIGSIVAAGGRISVRAWPTAALKAVRTFVSISKQGRTSKWTSSTPAVSVGVPSTRSVWSMRPRQMVAGLVTQSQPALPVAAVPHETTTNDTKRAWEIGAVALDGRIPSEVVYQPPTAGTMLGGADSER